MKSGAAENDIPITLYDFKCRWGLTNIQVHFYL